MRLLLAAAAALLLLGTVAALSDRKPDRLLHPHEHTTSTDVTSNFAKDPHQGHVKASNLMQCYAVFRKMYECPLKAPRGWRPGKGEVWLKRNRVQRTQDGKVMDTDERVPSIRCFESDIAGTSAMAYMYMLLRSLSEDKMVWNTHWTISKPSGWTGYQSTLDQYLVRAVYNALMPAKWESKTSQDMKITTQKRYKIGIKQATGLKDHRTFKTSKHFVSAAIVGRTGKEARITKVKFDKKGPTVWGPEDYFEFSVDADDEIRFALNHDDDEYEGAFYLTAGRLAELAGKGPQTATVMTWVFDPTEDVLNPSTPTGASVTYEVTLVPDTTTGELPNALGLLTTSRLLFDDKGGLLIDSDTFKRALRAIYLNPTEIFKANSCRKVAFMLSSMDVRLDMNKFRADKIDRFRKAVIKVITTIVSIGVAAAPMGGQAAAAVVELVGDLANTFLDGVSENAARKAGVLKVVLTLLQSFMEVEPEDKPEVQLIKQANARLAALEAKKPFVGDVAKKSRGKQPVLTAEERRARFLAMSTTGRNDASNGKFVIKRFPQGRLCDQAVKRMLYTIDQMLEAPPRLSDHNLWEYVKYQAWSDGSKALLEQREQCEKGKTAGTPTFVQCTTTYDQAMKQQKVSLQQQARDTCTGNMGDCTSALGAQFAYCRPNPDKLAIFGGKLGGAEEAVFSSKMMLKLMDTFVESGMDTSDLPSSSTSIWLRGAEVLADVATGAKNVIEKYQEDVDKVESDKSSKEKQEQQDTQTQILKELRDRK